jgi:hypothetical protein
VVVKEEGYRDYLDPLLEHHRRGNLKSLYLNHELDF